jgi:DMSO/TMAO reductase YedYZ molybdopterin-dependent catalytic subunit
MNPENDTAAREPDDTHCAEVKPLDETPDGRESELAAAGSSTLPQVQIDEPEEAKTHDVSDSPEQPQLAAFALLPPVEVAGKIELPITRDTAPVEAVEEKVLPAETAPAVAERTVAARKAARFFEEQPPETIEVAPQVLHRWSRRDLLLFGAGAVTALVGGGGLLPQATLERLGVSHTDKPWPGKEWILNRALRIDDDVAEALYSPNRLVPTYSKSQITPLKNNYNGATPDPSYIPGWRLTVDGLSSGLTLSLDIQTLLTRFRVYDQITRFVCVEGWSAIAWWSGLKFDDFLQAYPPVSQAKWARIESSVNLDAYGNPDPYYASLDLATARQPQTLLATHYNGQPLTVDHGAPLRLRVPVKLGLKNVKAITRISYRKEEPKDYWAKRGYSRYDGI